LWIRSDCRAVVERLAKAEFHRDDEHPVHVVLDEACPVVAFLLAKQASRPRRCDPDAQICPAPPEIHVAPPLEGRLSLTRAGTS
jgi:hypothetical protein